MTKRLMIIGGLMAAIGFMALPQLAAAGPVPVEGEVTLAAGDTSVAWPVALTAASTDIERIVIYNAGAVTCAVSVAVNDLGVSTPLDTFALAATAGASRYPPGRPLVTYEQVTVVTGDVPIVRQNASTNWVPIAARDLTFTFAKSTNATDCVYKYRIFTRNSGLTPVN